ncbi:MAG: DUF1036 domain-containing protein [Pseudomonadota bacterium]
MKKSLALALALGAVSAAAPAAANFAVCNETELRQSVAIAYKDGETWVSEGWWNIEPGGCKTLLAGDLQNRYYYYRAMVAGGTFPGEDFWFCTATSAFTIRGNADCPGRGYAAEVFSEIDTGETATTFKLSLVP